MNGIRITAMAMAVVFASAVSSAAQDKGYWRADSSNAKSTTGDIVISDMKLSINFSRFTIAEIRNLTPAETAAVFDASSNSNAHGDLYRLMIPGSKSFLHHNTLCGSDDTQWMATWASGQQLQVAFFSGAKMPVFTVDALSNSSNVCGLFSYQR